MRLHEAAPKLIIQERVGDRVKDSSYWPVPELTRAELTLGRLHYARDLCEPLGHQASTKASISFQFEDPFRFNSLAARWEVDQLPSVVFRQCIHLILTCFCPFLCIGSFHSLLIGDRISPYSCRSCRSQ